MAGALYCSAMVRGKREKVKSPNEKMSLFSRIRSVGVVILIIAVIAAVVGKMFASSMPASITISAQSWRNTSFNVATTVRCCDIERRHISTLSREEVRT